MASRFAALAHGVGGIVWIVGGTVILLNIAVRHFRAYPPLI